MTVVNHVALVDRNITGWFVSRSGNAHGEAAQEHHNGIAACHNGKCLPQADGSRSLEETDQFLCQRSANHSATAETTDSHTRCHTDTVREPFDQCGNRSDVTETKTDTADNCGKPCDPQLMSKGGDSHHEEEETETATGSQTAFAWASMFQPVTEDSGCRTEHEEQNAEYNATHDDFPVAFSGKQLSEETHVRRTCQRFTQTLRYANQFGHWQPENGHTIAHADAQVDHQRGSRHKPAIKTFASNRVFLPERFQ